MPSCSTVHFLDPGVLGHSGSRTSALTQRGRHLRPLRPFLLTTMVAVTNNTTQQPRGRVRPYAPSHWLRSNALFRSTRELLTCAGLAVIVQSVSGQTEAVEGAGRTLADVLAAVLRLQTQIHTCSGEQTERFEHLYGPIQPPTNIQSVTPLGKRPFCWRHTSLISDDGCTVAGLTSSR